MSNDSRIITRLEQKIHQLSPLLLTEIEDYLDFLLTTASENITAKTPTTEISDAEIEAVCGLYQADCTVSLENMKEAIVQGALHDYC